jgi:hypothetical protein
MLTIGCKATTAFTVKEAEPEAEPPAPLLAVTLQDAVPWLEVPTVILPEVPDPEAEAPAPEQLTDAEAALPVVQLKVAELPAVTDATLKDAPVTCGALTADSVAPPELEPPAAL